MIKTLFLAAAMMGGTILAANAVTYIAPQAPVPHGNALGIQLVKSAGTPSACSEAVIQVACAKQPYDSCAANYRRTYNC